MAGLDFSDKVSKSSEKLESMEQMLGKGLLQPFSNLNAGSRKIMHSTHRDHIFPLISGEKAIIETGYEIRFGDYSSSVTKTDHTYTVVGKISKYSFSPNHHYWLILADHENKVLDVQERISYHYITESYGYLYNNDYMDSLDIGDIVPKDTVLQKSLAFDEYNNRKDGVNFNVIYMALDDNMEDSMIFSDKAASRLTSPLIKPVQIMINNNDVPLNIYGNSNDNYKIIPDIGEEIKDANLIAMRKEKKEESYFAQSVENLRSINMSDSVKQIKGRVIDIDIYCNNPEILDSLYYRQLKMYYDELQRSSQEIVTTIMPFTSQGYKFTYDLEKLFGNAKQVMNHYQYIDKKTFSNIILNITVLDEIPMNAGDKASNRYGGKGVISSIWPQEFMPRYKTPLGEYEYVDVIFNSSTMINRENVGQNFELSLTHIGNEIVYKIQKEKLSLEESYKMVLDYITICSPDQAKYLEETVSKLSRDELMFFMESIIESGSIHLSIKPISDTMTIDKLAQLYDKFPWVKQNTIEVALRSSDGKTVRHIPARRNMVMGKQYIFRLKQFAEEKFSATSLSSTNLRNENIKSKAKKVATSLYSNTPIRFGNMETNNFMHMGAEYVIANLMIHSISPQARRLTEQLYTCDPFVIDIKLNSDSKNRSAEIANTYLKTIGRRLVFEKRKKHIEKITISPITFFEDPVKEAITFVPKQLQDGFDYEKAFKERQELEKKKKKTKAVSPLLFDGVDMRRS